MSEAELETPFPWPYFGEPLTELTDVLVRMHARVMKETTYCGIETWKNPTDAWVYEEIIWKQRPEVIIEIGTWHGGHLLKLAHQCDLMDHGEVIGIDFLRAPDQAVLAHPRITFIHGEATASAPQVHKLVGKRAAFVIEDSGHSVWNTLAVLRNYWKLIPKGGYFVVEDTMGAEAMEAVEIFLAENANFEADRHLEEFGVSWNPMGYLRRI